MNRKLLVGEPVLNRPASNINCMSPAKTAFPDMAHSRVDSVPAFARVHPTLRTI